MNARRFLTMVLLAVLLALPVLSACSPSEEAVAGQKVTCFENQKTIKIAMDAIYADSGTYPPTDQVVPKLGVECPSEGVYSRDPDTDTVNCSIHGHR